MDKQEWALFCCTGNGMIALSDCKKANIIFTWCRDGKFGRCL